MSDCCDTGTASGLLADQRKQWAKGQPKPVESYLEDYPQLQGDAEAVVDLIYQEFILRQQRGESVKRDDYLRRFPDYADQLLIQFELDELLESPRCSGTQTTVVRPALPSTSPPSRKSPTETPNIPGYEITGELGSGGMGVVFLARQLRLNREVAIKVIRESNRARPKQLARLRTEAEVIARLKHPNIVQIHEVGERDTGPYLVLEFVEGGSLAQQLAGVPQPPRPAAQLVETLARTVHHAHQHGIIHRDLKPANILLQRKSEVPIPESEKEGSGSDFRFRISDFVPKITDFGLAKFLDNGESTSESGVVVGTAGYMPPEQASAAQPIGPAADVYALGAILYEMLTGRRPFQGANKAETILQVLTEEPVPPRRLQPRLPRDLETICLKCLEKKPSRRYVSAQGLAEDLARFLAGVPIQARPVGPWERAAKWARRRPAVATLTALTFAIAVLGFGMVTWQWRAAESARANAEQAQRLEQEERRQVEAAQTREAEQRRRFQRLSVNLLVDRGLQLCAEGDARRGLLQLVRGLELTPDDDPDLQRVIRTNLADWSLSLCALKHALAHRGRVLGAAFSPDGRWAVTGTSDKKAVLWNVATGKQIGSPLPHSARVNAVSFSPDGSRLLTGTGDPGSATGAAWLWDVASRQLVHGPLTHSGPVWAVAFSPDGSKILTGSGDSASNTGLAELWDSATGLPLGGCWPHRRPVRAVAFSPNGQTILTGCDDRMARLWDAASGALRSEWKHGGYVQAVAFSPDGKTILTGSRDSTAQLWDLSTGRPLGEPMRHEGYVEAVAFSPDGLTVLTGSRDASARLWSAATGKLVGSLLRHQDQVTAVAISRDGRTILTGSLDRGARICQTAPGKTARRTFRLPNQVWAAAYSPNGRTVVTGRSNGIAQLWDVTHGHPLGKPLLTSHPINSLVFSPDGKLFLAGCGDKTARLYDAPTGKPFGEPLDHPAPVLAVAFNSDGKMFLTGCRDGKARLWDVATRKPLGILHIQSSVCAAAFDPKNPNLILTGCSDKTARLWDLTTGKCVRELPKHQGPVWAVAFSPDGRSIITGSEDWTARVWDSATGQLLGEPLLHHGTVTAVAFSPDGHSLLTASRDGKARLWDGATHTPLGMPMPHQGPVRAAAFSPDGRTVLTAGEDMAAKLWTVPTPMTGELEQIKLWCHALAGTELDEVGVARILDMSSWRALKSRVRQVRPDEPAE